MNGSVPRQSGQLCAGAIREALADTGIYCPSQEFTLDQFRAAAGELGDVFYEADVRMGAEKPRNYQLPAAIDFHTDHASAEIAAWWCEERESDGGAMQFVDLWPVVEAMNDAELEALGRVRVPDNAVWSEGGDIPVCWLSNGRRVFHYVPWLMLDAPDAEARSALAKFENGIAEAKAERIAEFDLKPGEVVFVDNHRIMHGRRAIPANSKRNLKRLWIRSCARGEQAA